MDLSLVDTDMLLDELRNRFDAFCFIGESQKDEDGQVMTEKADLWTRYKGSWAHSLGLLEYAKLQDHVKTLGE